MSALAGAFAIAVAVCALVLALWSLLAHLGAAEGMRQWRQIVLERTPTPDDHLELAGRVDDLERELEAKVPDDPPKVESLRQALDAAHARAAAPERKPKGGAS